VADKPSEQAVFLRNKELQFFIPDRIQVAFDYRSLYLQGCAEI
jgi:hypothetical protein